MIKKLLGGLAVCIALVQPGIAQSLEEKTIGDKVVEQVDKEPNVPRELRRNIIRENILYSVLSNRLRVELDNGSRIIGQNGFSLFPTDKNRIKFGEQNISYAYSDGKNLLPKKESLEKELSCYLAYSLSYPDLGSEPSHTIEKERMVTAKTAINRESLKITAIFPDNYTLASYHIHSRFKITQDVNLNLREFYDIAREIVESEIRHPDELPVNVFKNNRNRYRFSMASSGNDVVYVITAKEKYWDRKSEFSVMFANHFTAPRNYKPDNVENLDMLGDFSKLPRLKLTTGQKEILSKIRDTH